MSTHTSPPATDITSLIGRTPLMWLTTAEGRRIFLKLEKFNPTQSMKDRMALAIIESAERRGVLRAGGTIIESSSGNTATALAMVAAARGYSFIAVMDHHASKEKVAAVLAYGARVVFVGDDQVPSRSLETRHAAIHELRADHPEAFFVDQPDNPDNPTAYEAMADELILRIGRVDVLVGAVGSGGSLCGTARSLRAKQANLCVMGVEPRGSALFSAESGDFFAFGAGRTTNMPVPRNVAFDLIDKHVSVPDVEAFNLVRSLARKRGVLLGPTSGAAISAALTGATQFPSDSQIVVLAPDGGEKYLSTIFDDDWMRARHLLDDAIAAHADAAFACFR